MPLAEKLEEDISQVIQWLSATETVFVEFTCDTAFQTFEKPCALCGRR